MFESVFVCAKGLQRICRPYRNFVDGYFMENSELIIPILIKLQDPYINSHRHQLKVIKSKVYILYFRVPAA